MLKNSTHIHEFFEKHANATYELIQIQDIHLQEEPYYYITVFRDIYTNRNENVLIPPELLRIKYKLGYYYKAGKKVGINKSLEKQWINIKVSPNDEIKRNVIIFGDESKILINGLNHHHNHFFYRQPSLVYEQEDCVLVIPCSAISIRFYFLSSSMKKAIMNGKLDELYYDKPHFENNVVKILIKKRANKKDLPFLCRFLINKEAESKCKYFFNQRSKSHSELYPLRCHFPVSGEFRILATYKILEYTLFDKPVLYVQNIINDESELGFEELLYKQIVEGEDPNKTPPTNFPMGKRRRFQRKKFPKDNKIRTGSPSSENQFEIIFESAERDANTRNLHVSGENIYIPPLPCTAAPSNANENKTGSQSFEPPDTNGNKNMSQAAYVELPENKSEKLFTLADFIEFYDALMEQTGVEELDSISLNVVPQVMNKKRKKLKAFCINCHRNKERNYIFSTFAYNNRCIYLVEFEQDTAWAPSTWFFVSMDDSSTNYDIDTIEVLIQYYFEEEKATYTMLEKEAISKYKLAFIHHNHKKDEIDDITIDSWCELLLDKILNIQGK